MRLLIILAFGFLSISCSEARQSPFGACPIPGYENDDSVNCGTIEVPENRNDPNSRKIQLAFMVLKARKANAEKDPIVYLTGGPGGATLIQAGVWANSPLRRDRDFVLVDQRGTGYSNAVCTDFGTHLLSVIAEDYDMEEEGKALRQIAAGCKAELRKKGVDQAGYNTIHNAQDLDDLRKALGYEKWNLFGGSYGARLALAYMRDFPGQTRTAVLSGLFPPQANLYGKFVSNFERSLSLMFDACEADGSCNRRYPDIRKTYFEVFNSLKQQPYTFNWGGEPFVLNAQDMLMLTHQLLYARQTYGQIPDLVMAIKEKDESVLQAAVQTLSGRAQIINFAMNWSFNAYDEIPFNGPADIRKDLEAHPELKPGPAFFMNDSDIVADWHPHRGAAYVNEPVKSDIPTLLANGNFDPVTPPDNARETLKTLTNAYYAEFPSDGHSVFGGCYFGMVQQFLDKPDKAPNMDCAAKPLRVNWR